MPDPDWSMCSLVDGAEGPGPRDRCSRGPRTWPLADHDSARARGVTLWPAPAATPRATALDGAWSALPAWHRAKTAARACFLPDWDQYEIKP